jgi:hypothetical protein
MNLNLEITLYLKTKRIEKKLGPIVYSKIRTQSIRRRHKVNYILISQLLIFFPTKKSVSSRKTQIYYFSQQQKKCRITQNTNLFKTSWLLIFFTKKKYIIILNNINGPLLGYKSMSPS